MASHDRADETEESHKDEAAGRWRVGVDHSCTVGKKRAITGCREPDDGTLFGDPVLISFIASNVGSVTRTCQQEEFGHYLNRIRPPSFEGMNQT